MCNSISTIDQASNQSHEIEQRKEIEKIERRANISLVNLAANALVKIDNATLDLDSEFAKFSKKEMDIAFILFASFSSLDTVLDTVKVNNSMEKAIVLQNQHIKELCGLYSKTRRISKKDYKAYVDKVKAFFRKAEFTVHFVIEDENGKKHIIEGTAPIFGPILDVDNGEALLITLYPKANNVFFDFLPKVSFSKFLLRKFLDLKFIYSKILFYKLINYKRRYGWTVSVDDLVKEFNLNTKTRRNNFYVRLNEYVNDVLATGYFEKIEPVIHRKKEGVSNSPVVSIEFKVIPKESAFNVHKKIPQKIPLKISVVTKITRDMPVDDGSNLPRMQQVINFEKKEVSCPYCKDRGGKIVHWVDGNHNDCFACTHSKYWANKLDKEDEVNCNFFASTANANSLTKKNLKGSYDHIHDWLADNTHYEDEKRNITKEDCGNGNYYFRGNITPAMEKHNIDMDKINDAAGDKDDQDNINPPFPFE